MVKKRAARLFLISGRVQGVGYRAFAVNAARGIGVVGWARNLADGRVEVHAIGTAEQLEELEACLRSGPRFADVQSVEVSEAPASGMREFSIRS
jgi:acylphosphatase